MKLRLIIALLMITVGLQAMQPAASDDSAPTSDDQQKNLSLQIACCLPRINKKRQNIQPGVKSIFIDYSSCVDHSNINSFMKHFSKDTAATLWNQADDTGNFNAKKYPQNGAPEVIAIEVNLENIDKSIEAGASNIAIVSLLDASNTKLVNDLAEKLLPHHNAIVFNADKFPYEECMLLTSQHIPVQPINMSKEQVAAALANQTIIAQTMQNAQKITQILDAAQGEKLITQTGKDILEGTTLLAEAARKQKAKNATLHSENDGLAKQNKEQQENLKQLNTNLENVNDKLRHVDTILDSITPDSKKKDTVLDKVVAVLTKVRELGEKNDALNHDNAAAKDQIASLKKDLTEAEKNFNIELAKKLGFNINTTPTPVSATVTSGRSWRSYLGITTLLATIGAILYRYRHAFI